MLASTCRHRLRFYLSGMVEYFFNCKTEISILSITLAKCQTKGAFRLYRFSGWYGLLILSRKLADALS